METEEQRFLLNKVIEKNRHFENLMANDDFLKWKSENVEAYLEDVLTAIKTVDRKSPNWKDAVCDAVIAYQEGVKMCDKLFTMATLNSEMSRKALQKLSEAQGQSS